MDNRQDKIIKSKLENNKITPNPASWDKLNALLDAEEMVTEVTTPKKYFKLKRISVAAAILICFALAGYYFMKENEKNNYVQNLKQEDRGNEVYVNQENKNSEKVMIYEKSITSIPQTAPKTVNTSPVFNAKPEKRETVEITDINSLASEVKVIKPDFKITIDARDILNQEVNRFLVSSVNPKMTSALVEEVRKLDLAQIMDELNEQDPELESQFRKKVVKKLNTIYAQISDRNIIKE